MFDIATIIADCPNAWRRCLIFFGYDIGEDRGIHTYEDIVNVSITDDGSTIILWMKYNQVEYISIRALYDFFDSLDMVIIPCTNLIRTKTLYLEEDNYRVHMKKDVDRHAIEYAAFTKMFKYLEDRIIYGNLDIIENDTDG